jgi:hypothetical protein
MSTLTGLAGEIIERIKELEGAGITKVAIHLSVLTVMSWCRNSVAR